jgi:hypothetical protein
MSDPRTLEDSPQEQKRGRGRPSGTLFPEGYKKRDKKLKRNQSQLTAFLSSKSTTTPVATVQNTEVQLRPPLKTAFSWVHQGSTQFY